MAFSLGDAIVFFRGDDKQLEKDTEKAKGKIDNFVGKAGKLLSGALVGGAAAAGAAVIGIGTAAFDVSLQTERAAASIAASLGKPIEEAEKFADVARRVYGNNLADSVEDAGEAVANIAKALGLTADDPALQTLTENAFRLRDAFGVETADSISAVQTLIENFGLDGQEAFDLIAAGFQRGLDRSGDFLDTINEYSTQFASGGASAQEFFGLLDSGLQGGALGTDKAADAFKEFRLRIQDGSQLTADSLAAIGLNADEITQKLSDGSMTAADAWNMVMTALQQTEDPVTRFNAGVGLIGSQFEDLGDKMALNLDLTADWAEGTTGAINTLDAKYATFGAAVDAIWRRLVTSISPFTDKLLEIVNDAMPSVMAAFDTFDKNVGPIMEGAQRIIDQVVGYIKDLFNGFRTSVDDDATGPLQYWKQWADTNLPLIKQLFETILNGLKAFWETWGPAIQLLVDTTFGNIWTAIDTTMRNIGDVITLALQLLTGDFEGAKTTLEGIVQRTWDAIKTIFGNSIDAVKQLVSEIDWQQLGKDIIEGISNGISNAVGKIAEAARSAARSAYEAAKSWLGISSPSRKAAKDIGEPFAEGIAEGATKGLAAATAGVNRGIADFFGAMQQPATVAAGSTFNITVNLSGGTYDTGRAVGRGILDELRAAGMA